MRHVERLRPLPVLSPTKITAGDAGGERKSSKEEERRKAMNFRRPQSHRKVFEGGKHTRALSLLSPSTLGQAKNHVGFDGSRARKDQTIRKASGRSATMTEATSIPIGLPSTAAALKSKGTKDDLVNTGKQLVGDLKEGLWTFIEDIRQATVGDEAINSARPRHKRKSSLGRSPARSSSQSRTHITPTRTIQLSRRKAGLSESLGSQLKKSDTLIDIEGISVSNTNASGKRDPSNVHHLDGTSEESLADAFVDDEGWDNWDSPSAKHSSHSLNTQDSSRMASPSLCANSSRTSTSSSDDYAARSKDSSSLANADQLPWPALTKLSPSNLTRTASTLMKEWEASLMTPVEGETKGRPDLPGEAGTKLD